MNKSEKDIHYKIIKLLVYWQGAASITNFVNYFKISHQQPHIFIKTGLRWHFRAFDEKHMEFHDFILSRARGTPEVLDKGEKTIEQDLTWNMQVKMVFVPNQRLSTPQKKVIEQDYQMCRGQLVITSQAALVQYLLKNASQCKISRCIS